MKMTISLPDDLGQRIKSSSVNRSAICQAAFALHLGLINDGEFLEQLHAISHPEASDEPATKGEVRKLRKELNELKGRVDELIAPATVPSV